MIMGPKPRTTRLNSESSPKCICKKPVNDDDSSAIGCSSCGKWVHGPCVGLSIDDVRWLGTKANLQWLCDNCLQRGDKSTICTEAKLDALFNDLSDKINTTVTNLVPKLISEVIPGVNENVKEAVTKSLPSYSDIVSGSKKSLPNTELQFVITGIPENESSYFKQIENDSIEIDGIMQHMGLHPENNITAIRRLGKITKSSPNELASDRPRCRPLLVTTSNDRFLNNCFARSHYLQNYINRVYIKKFLSHSDRQTEKNLLAKRYQMITSEAKNKKDFRIKNLKLYYKGAPVDISSN